MNLTKQPPYRKGVKRARNKAPTSLDRKYWKAVAAVGCIVKGLTPCEGRITIHHCGTGAGGRKDHRKVIPLCENHHTGKGGIHTLGRKVWQSIHGTEDRLMVVLGRKIDKLDNPHVEP